MPTDTTVSNLIINKLTKAQYDQIQNPSDTELYLVPDVIDSEPTSGSTNCVESGGVYSALQDKLDAPSTAGTSGQVLTSDGQGGQSWQTPSGGGGTATDVQVNGTSITSNNVANIVTNTAYNASSNKIATMSDLPSVPVTDVTVGGTSVVSSGTAVIPAIPDVTSKADKVSSATSGNFASLDSNGNLADSGHKHSDYLTSHQDISSKADKVSSATNGNFAALDSNGNLTDSGHKHSDYLTSHQSLSNYVQKSNTAGLLKNDGTVDTTGYGTYSKPSGGIPSSDLAQAVQTSLGKADTALQSYTETDPTVPSWAKASTKPSYDYSEISHTPENVSSFTNDAGYLTSSDVVTIYSGSAAPSSSFGSNGDIYIQTS